MANLSDLIAQSTSDNPQKLVNLALATQMMGSGSDCSGSGLGGTNYVFVKGDGTPEENAVELQAAYNEAKKMPRFLGSSLLSPSNSSMYYKGQTFYYSDGGTPAYYMFTESTAVPTPVPGVAKAVISELEAKSTRTTVVVAPGEYKFDDMSMSFNMNDCGINVVSLTGLPDVIIDNLSVGSQCRYSHFRGLKCKGGFHVEASAYPDMIFENCQGGNNSFGKSNDYENRPDAGGIYINCVGGDNSFGYISTGKFYNCKAGDDSYGTNNEASGEFYNCTGEAFAFGGNGTFSGTATNCTGGYRSFGGTISSAARLYYCRLTSDTFPTPAVGGKLVLCIDGDDTVVTTP